MKTATTFLIFLLLSSFNVLDATDAEYDQLRTYLRARFQKETYTTIANDFSVHADTVSHFVRGETKKSSKILNQAKIKYPYIFQQSTLPHLAVITALVPAVETPLIIVQQPVIKQEAEPALLGQYLLLPNLKAGSKYVISMVPMNSSGDSYHILAYLILAKSHQKVIPDILLTYDGAAEIRPNESNINTYTQVQRTLHFAKVLGYEEYFKTAFIDTGTCQRENNRQSKLEKYLGETEYTNYIDQKALTTMISEHFRNFGRENTTQRLRDGFNKYSPKYLSTAACNKLFEDVLNEVKRIGVNPNPLIAMHMRYSSKANEKQNVENGVIEKLSNYIRSKGYNVWFIFTDGRQTGSFKTLGNDRTAPFPFITTDGADNGKYFHLQLLLNLSGLPNLRGIIGNTSGTLDLAGFLGHNVYNLHNVQQAFDYQSCRILIQSSFLTAERLSFDLLTNALRTPQGKLGEFDDEIAGEYLPHLNGWVMGGQAITAGRAGSQSTINSRNAGYNEMFFIKEIRSNLLSPLQSLISTIAYLQGIEPAIKIEA